MCARPMAPPPSRATPILGRRRGVFGDAVAGTWAGGVTGAASCCAWRREGSRHKKKTGRVRRIRASKSANLGWPIFYLFGFSCVVLRCRDARFRQPSFLENVAAVRLENLAGYKGSFSGSQKLRWHQQEG